MNMSKHKPARMVRNMKRNDSFDKLADICLQPADVYEIKEMGNLPMRT
jgi:ferredoxin-like protein FixX